MSGPGNARPHIFRVAEHSHLTPWLAGLQAQCISHDRMIGSFLPPLSHEKLLTWWKDRIAEVRAGSRSIIMLLDESEPGAKVKGEELVGVVMLATPPLETAPFRASVESLLVSTKYRRRGGATMLLRALHEEAYRAKKTLLVSPWERSVYRQATYRKSKMYLPIRPCHSWQKLKVERQQRHYSSNCSIRKSARCPSMPSIPRGKPRMSSSSIGTSRARHA